VSIDRAESIEIERGYIDSLKRREKRRNRNINERED